VNAGQRCHMTLIMTSARSAFTFDFHMGTALRYGSESLIRGMGSSEVLHELISRVNNGEKKHAKC
jgi:hypothetical protein